MLVLLEICQAHQIPFYKVAQWLSENPANRFGLDNKGKIEVGYDADFAIVSAQPFTVTREVSYAKHKDSIYEGVAFSHAVVATYCQGKCVFQTEVEVM